MIPVLFLAYYFPPAGGAGVQRSQKFVRYLPNEGFQPVVVTGPGPSGDRWSPADLVMAGEVSSEVQVLRAKGPIPQNSSRWNGRMNRWFGTTDVFSSWWIENAIEAALPVVERTMLIFATMSPFSTAVIAARLSAKFNIPWVADLRDPWALDEMQVYPSRFHRASEIRRMGRDLASASAIIMNTPEATQVLLQQFPEFAKKIVTTITNGYDAQDFEGAIGKRSDGKFRIVHTGYLHTQGGLELKRKQRLRQLLGGIEGGVDILTRSHVVLLRAIEQWLKKRPEVENDLEIVFAGVTSEPDKAAVMKSGVANSIQFPGYLSHRESVELVRTADVLFLPMHNLDAGRRSRIVPGKTYEYIAAGQPILAAVPEGDARDFLKAAGTARITNPDDVQAMIDELDRLYLDWKSGKQNVPGNPEFMQRFSRENLSKELATVFAKVIRGTNS